MGDKVKEAIRGAVSYSEAQNLYSNLELISIGYELDENLETPLVAAWCDEALEALRQAVTPARVIEALASRLYVLCGGR